MKLTQKEIKKFQQYIFTWWKTHRRDLSWRRTHDPYKILVSEVMLQQTQVSRVLPKYDEFLAAFPSVNALGQASSADVLRVWKGMGYNRRALYLKKAAQMVIDQYKRVFPKSEQELVKLPGLGRYTARAILVFAYRQEAPLVDTNIRQIITHYFFKDQAQKESVIEEVALQLVPSGKSWEWHQALMDYGALELNVSRATYHVSRKKTIPFRESNRFYRGRIIDQLRQGNISRSMLISDFQKKYGKSKVFIHDILAGLEKDGLLVRFAYGTIGLPKE